MFWSSVGEVKNNKVHFCMNIVHIVYSVQWLVVKWCRRYYHYMYLQYHTWSI